MGVMDSPGAGRVLVALSDGPLVAEPTWTRFDDESVSAQTRCHGFDCQTGRQSEFDVVDTGRATVYFHDRAQALDDSALVGCQIMLQLYNPVADEWQPRWRGHIDDISHELLDTPGIPFANVRFICTGIFDYLGNCHMLPGEFGHALPAGYTGTDVVFYEDGPINERLVKLFADALIDEDMYVNTSGNVDVNETQYDVDDVILVALRDAADAEFPGLALIYEDRFGRAVWHGRFARLDPENTADDIPGLWDFTRWYAATREDVTSGVAQIREFQFNRPRARLVNTFVAWPRADENGFAFDRTLIPTLQKMDPTSISAYGYRNAIGNADDLIIKKHKTNGNTGAEECGLFGDFFMANFSTIRKALERVTFNSVRPADARAEATWDLMCRIDVSDAINLTVDEAQIADEPYFVDGVSVECRPANPEYDFVTVTPNLTPGSYYGTDVFSE